MNYCSSLSLRFRLAISESPYFTCTYEELSKKYLWTNKCKWSVGISSVNFHGKFALKFEMRGFMNDYSHLELKVKLDVILTNVYSLLLVKLIYGNNLVKYLHQGINKSTFESFYKTASKISQPECLFMISNDKLPV